MANLFFDQLVNGVVLGSMYALMASGLTLIWGTMRMLNFAHGEFYMLSGFFFWSLTTSFGVPGWIALPLVVLVIFLVGVACARLLIQPLMSSPHWEMGTVIVTLGLSIVLQNGALQIFGAEYHSLPYFSDAIVELFGVRLSMQRLLVVAVTLAALGAIWFLLNRTRLGMALRAAAQDRDSATLFGVDVSRAYTMTFGLAAALAGLAAIMLAPIYSVSPWMGHPPLLKALVVVVLGGLGSFHGAIVGGYLLGLLESMGVVALSSEWSEVFAFAVLILTVWLRPYGLFGRAEAH